MTNTHPLPAPRDHDLDEAVQALAARGDNVGVVRIVEAWAAQGTPTAKARLVEARALFALRLMDRALNRTREVLDAEPDHVDALLLQARIYLERGWPLKARKPLQQLKDAGQPDIDGLWARAHADPVRPEANAREIEREGNPTKLLALAEGFLATGSFLRATGILERLRRTDPENPRIKELLWSLAGDFGAGQPLATLLATLAPPRLPREPTSEEPEHTESLDLRASDLDPEEAGAAAFPALFKYAPGAQPTESGDPHEATQTSGLATPAQMGEAGGAGTDPGVRLANVTAADPSDTQIMLVLRPGEERAGAPSGPVHRRRDGAEPARDPLNLRAWQQSMGVAATSDLSDAPDDLLEEEDENVVVMMRAEAPAPAPPPPPETFDKPIEVIEKHATPVAVPELEPDPEPTAPKVARQGSRMPRLLVPLGIAAVVGALLLTAAAVGGLATRSTGAESARTELVRALASEDYNALLTMEGRLEQRLGSGVRASEVAEVRAALAETRLVLWSDYNGDPQRLAQARADIEAGGGLDVHRVAILRAAEALARQDMAGAAAALGREKPEDDEERVLFARIAWRGGDLDRALEHLAALDHPEYARYQLARAEILAEAGRVDDARAAVAALLKADPDHAAARILQIELERGEPAATLAAVSTFLASPSGKNLPPRLEGRLEVLQARAYLALGQPDEAREATERGLSRDGANPDLLFLRAADLAAQQKLTPALHEITSVVTARPGSAEAQTAYVLLLLDLDRVEEAEDAVVRLEADGMLPNLTPVLDTLVSVWGLQDTPTAELLPPQRETPLGAVAVAARAVRDLLPEARALVDVAVAAARGSGDPFVRRLAPRLVAMRALVPGATDPEADVTAALAEGAEDPAVHVYVARYYEAADKKALAAQHFDRAAQLGPELGLAWYEKGRFYLDARDGFSRSGAAWRNFLALAPSGPRAARAKDTLGLR